MRRFPSSEPYDGSADDAPISKLWIGLIVEGLRDGDERIQVLPGTEDEFIIRACSKGAWRDIMRPPAKMYRAFMQRLKVMANFSLARRIPIEEGRFEVAYRDSTFEIKATVRARADGSEEAVVDLPALPPNKRLKLAGAP